MDFLQAPPLLDSMLDPTRRRRHVGLSNGFFLLMISLRFDTYAVLGPRELWVGGYRFRWEGTWWCARRSWFWCFGGLVGRPADQRTQRFVASRSPANRPWTAPRSSGNEQRCNIYALSTLLDWIGEHRSSQAPVVNCLAGMLVWARWNWTDR
jgi:hypothetical protein